MFKKKGSSTNVAIVCSLICAALGVFYGLSSKSSTPAVAPVVNYAQEAALNTTAGVMQFSPDGLTSIPAPPPTIRSAAYNHTAVGTTRFLRPASGTAVGTPVRGTMSFSRRPAVGNASIESFSRTGIGTATFAVPD